MKRRNDQNGHSSFYFWESLEHDIMKTSLTKEIRKMERKIDAMWDDSPVDVTTEVNFIWSIANKLRGPYHAEKYKDVIIPMTIIRRFECALEKTKESVVKQYKENPKFPAKGFYRITDYEFYNFSEFTLNELINDPEHLAANFRNYLQGFSANVQDIIKNLDFDKEITKMDKNNRLYSVVKAFSELDLDPVTVDNVKMGYIFEDLIRRFSENAEAGDHYTGRDIVKVMVSIAMAEGCDDIFDEGKIIRVLDSAAGTGGMLSTCYNYIHRFNPTANVYLYSQEVNPESYAECLAEMLIKKQRAENIRLADTLMEDCFPNMKARFVLENPPFGQAWGGKDAPEGEEAAVKKEYSKGFDGRWGAGLPGTGDGQLLFVQAAVAKLDDENGRAVIVENGSPLFTGGVSSGESQIRRWLLENDLLEAIIALPTDLFYNTGIATYLWVISKNKRDIRKGKVQLIDASKIFHPLRKSLGNKRNEITPEDRQKITELYANFEENEICKIFDNEDFLYREYTVMQPLQRRYSVTEESIERMMEKGTLNNLYDESKVQDWEEIEDGLTDKERKKLEEYRKNKPVYDAIPKALHEAESPQQYMSLDAFKPVLKKALAGIPQVNAKLLEKIADGLSIMDKEAEIHTNKKGNILYDKETKDAEMVPYKESIDDYMAREVLPYVPDAKAFFEEDLTKKKPVIKTGAEIPFTRYFYKYEVPRPADELAQDFQTLEQDVALRIKKLFP